MPRVDTDVLVEDQLSTARRWATRGDADACAAVEDWPLLKRDTSRSQAYFPRLQFDALLVSAEPAHNASYSANCSSSSESWLRAPSRMAFCAFGCKPSAGAAASNSRNFAAFACVIRYCRWLVIMTGCLPS